MRIIDSVSEMQQQSDAWRRDGKRIAFVPTMGYLHAGHLALMQSARKHGDAVVISIFVNPTQFGPGEDFERYPRSFEKDIQLATEVGVDVAFVPQVREMYPEGFQSYVEVTKVTLPLCGRSRPGHFRGVCTVVLKLFNLVQPDIAVFGQKDAQQSLVVRRMARDLNIPARIVVAPTIREPDGLAMSSRNECLSPLERYRAAALCQALELARKAFRKGERNAAALKKLARRHLLKIPGLRLEYLELRNISHLRSVSQASHGDLLAVAAFLGKTRLIDNVRL